MAFFLNFLEKSRKMRKIFTKFQANLPIFKDFSKPNRARKNPLAHFDTFAEFSRKIASF